MKTERTGWYLGIGVFTAALFYFEIRMPLGFTPWLLYVIPLGLTYWAPYLYAPLAVAAICTILVVAGYVFSPAGAPRPIALTNRAFGVLTFWGLGLLILQYKILAVRLSQLSKSLATELAERTRDLGVAVSALQKEMELQHGEDRDLSEAKAELKRQVTKVLTAENRRLREKIARYERIERHVQEEEGLDKTREELVQLGHRLERLQRELLQD
jgi:hypothetical protein